MAFRQAHITRVKLDGVAAVAREGFCERRRIRLGPPQRLAGGDFHSQERQPDRDDLRCMPVSLDIAGQQREAGRRLFGGRCDIRFSGCGAVNSVLTTLPCSVTISTGTRPAPSSNSSRTGGFAASVASTKAVPTLGGPQTEAPGSP